MPFLLPLPSLRHIDWAMSIALESLPTDTPRSESAVRNCWSSCSSAMAGAASAIAVPAASTAAAKAPLIVVVLMVLLSRHPEGSVVVTIGGQIPDVTQPVDHGSGPGGARLIHDLGGAFH